jgi:hypothetical protein
MIPPLNTDWLEFVESFNANHVEYLIVGDFAVAHHGRPRLGGDLELWVKPGCKRILSALRQFGFGSVNLSESDFAESYQGIQLGFPPLRIDLITSIAGVPSFDEAWQRSRPKNCRSFDAAA